jgi:hypothetical protein
MTTIYRDFNREYIEDSEDIHVPINGFIGGIDVKIVPGLDRRIRLMVTGLQENGNAYFPLDYPCGQADVMVTIVEPTIDLYDAIMTVLDKITADHQYRLCGNPCDASTTFQASPTKSTVLRTSDLASNRGNPYKDFILCSGDLVQEHPELCYENNDQEERCYMGGHWMPFTRESLVYVDCEQEQEEDDATTYSYLPEIGEIREDNEPPVKWKSIMIHGEVKLDHDEKQDGSNAVVLLSNAHERPQGTVGAPGCFATGEPTQEARTVFTYDYPIISRDMGQKYYELTRGKPVYEVTYTDLYPDDENDQE